MLSYIQQQSLTDSGAIYTQCVPNAKLADIPWSHFYITQRVAFV